MVELPATGRLREGLGIADAVDVIWSMNPPELYLLLIGQRGWEPDRFRDWPADAWRRLLLEDG